MRLKQSNAGLLAKTTVALVIVASVTGIAVGVATQTGGAATKAPAVTAAVSGSSAPKAAVARAGNATGSAATGAGNAILAAAASQKGKAYCYGGGGINGPSGDPYNPPNPGCAKGTTGYDCMSLAQYAVYQGTGHEVALPSTGKQVAVGKFIPSQGTDHEGGLVPGDVVLWGGTVDDYHHSGIYAGAGEVWDAYDNNYPVAEHSFTFLEKSYNYDGAYRYFSVTAAPLPTGATQRSYTTTLHATGGIAPYRWALASGSKPLPPGLKLAATGVISGKATRAGTFPFEVQVVDTAAKGSPKETARRAFSLKITETG
jgi:NlpC/P60 family